MANEKLEGLDGRMAYPGDDLVPSDFTGVITHVTEQTVMMVGGTIVRYDHARKGAANVTKTATGLATSS